MAAFQTSIDGNLRILAISGRLDPQSGKDLKDTIQSLTGGENSSDLLVDLENLAYMASAGFRELFLAGRQISRQGGRLAVCSLRGEVKRVSNWRASTRPIRSLRHGWALGFLNRQIRRFDGPFELALTKGSMRDE